MTNLAINSLTIENFKSIKKMELKPKRINLFVGKPNTGKSNILEALSLFSVLPHGDLREFVRFEKPRHLFYDQNIKNPIEISTGDFSLSSRANDEMVILQTTQWKDGFNGYMKVTEKSQIDVEIRDGYIQAKNPIGTIDTKKFKKYKFRENQNNNPRKDLSYLQVPFGDNIFYMLETHPDLFEEVANYFTQYGLDLVLNQENDKMLTQKKIGKRVFQLPYSLVADTLQRMIFYLAAIKTNSESVLIFEEPEAHSFPPYVQNLANAIVDSTTNQFFIATHSPYLFNTILEEAPKEEVAVFITEFKDYQTVVHVVPEEDYGEIIDYGIDIFFNLRRAIKKDRVETS